MDSLQFPDKPVLLDGGLGRELRSRGVAVPTTIWSAGALISDPAVVRQIHLDYIAAVAKAACGTGRPVWVAWTLHEDQSGNLRSGESITDAVQALGDLPVSGFLVNCCAPESITRPVHIAEIRSIIDSGNHKR